MRQVFNISNSWQREAGLQAILEARDSQVVSFERTIVLSDTTTRGHAIELYRKLKAGWRVVLSDRSRTKDQNAMLWPILTQISKTFFWHGQKWTPEQWKHFFLNYLQCEMNYEVAKIDFMPAHDGGFIPVGRKSSALTVGQFSDLLELILMFCNKHKIDINNPKDRADYAA